jgi:hypothetical protein
VIEPKGDFLESESKQKANVGMKMEFGHGVFWGEWGGGGVDLMNG